MRKSDKDQAAVKPPSARPVRKSKGGRPTVAQAQVRAERLREIATEIFLEFGYERTSLTRIAKRAGASKETLYSQYASKEELFLAITTHALNDLEDFSSFFEAHGRPLEECLKDIGFRVLTGMTTGNSPLIALMIIAEATRFPEIGKLFWVNAHERAYAAMAQFLRLEVASGRVIDEDPELMARQLFDLLSAQVFMQSVFNVKRTMTATERRLQAEGAVKTFLRAFGT